MVFLFSFLSATAVIFSSKMAQRMSASEIIVLFSYSKQIMCEYCRNNERTGVLFRLQRADARRIYGAYSEKLLDN